MELFHYAQCKMQIYKKIRESANSACRPKADARCLKGNLTDRTIINYRRKLKFIIKKRNTIAKMVIVFRIPSPTQHREY